MRFLWQKIKDLSTLEKIEIMTKKERYFEKENVSIFSEALFTKREKAKYAGGIRSSSLGFGSLHQ